MDRLGRVEIFLEVAKRQSFAKAAKALGMTGPGVSKQVMALEDQLGVKLLHRTTRLVTLTDEGAIYYERARLALDELKEAAAHVQDMKTTPKGSLRINAPLSFGHMHLLPVLSGFAKKYPELTMEVALDDRRVDVQADGFDVVIRIGALADSTLVSRYLGDCPILLVASPEYLKKYGAPKSPSDLKQHRFIAYTNSSAGGEWRYKDANGKTGSVKMEPAFKANTAEMMLQAALDGVGVALLPIFSCLTYIQAKKLVHVLPAYETSPSAQIHALMLPSRHRATKVKLLVDWISQACRTMPIIVANAD